ncbi:hypothetical protein SDC9_125596 [bioreactor metagenome]|uniref:DUF951 domain-containing protein n=1 Tax=bioreactor metagenome TaxID=1076179 RepID=A0A645CNW4_9ZZZZ|nr:DUF951 domain-containing protein [Oscillospiraceae bacterium]
MIINVSDILELKKAHPCGSKCFSVMRIGSDIKIKCAECGREITLERIKLEKQIRKINGHNIK